MTKKGWIILGVVLAVLASGIAFWQLYLKDVLFAGDDGEVAYVQSVASLVNGNLGSQNWYAGVIEPQKTVKVNIESGRTVSEVKVSVGQRIKPGDLLFEYDLSSIEESLKSAQLEYDQLVNAALGYQETINSYQQQIVQPGQTASEVLQNSIGLEQAKMDLKKNEYDQIRKQNEITKLQSATGNTQVLAEDDGVVQKIDTSKLTTEDGDSLSMGSSSMGFGDDEDDSFITILGTGNYRVKGKANEMNIREFSLGSPVVVRSRVDNNQTWTGTLASIDQQNGSSNSDDSYGDSDSMTSSTSYPFYVDLKDSKDLMLGQHVYIEFDTYGARKSGLWLDETFILDSEGERPFVWVQGKNGRLELRYLTLGEYDSVHGEYLVESGLSEADYIASPEEYYEENMRTADIATKPSSDEDEDDEDWDEEDEDWDEDDEDWDIIDDSVDEDMMDSGYESDTSSDDDWYDSLLDDDFDITEDWD